MKYIGVALGVAALAAMFVALEAWLIMLVAGALHHEVHEGIPAIGFTASIWVAVALTIVGGFFKSSGSSR